MYSDPHVYQNVYLKSFDLNFIPYTGEKNIEVIKIVLSIIENFLTVFGRVGFGIGFFRDPKS